MRLAALIVSFNTAAATERCLRSLLQAGGIDEVVVADNASSDDSVARLRALQPAFLQQGIPLTLLPLRQNCGFSRALNLAAWRSRAGGLLLLNSDTELPAGSGARLAMALQQQPRRTALCCRQVDALGRLQLVVGPQVGYVAEALRRGVQRRFDAGSQTVRRGVDWLLRRPTQVAWGAASVLLVRRAAFVELGGFDERFFLFFEDIDFCVRLRQAGGAVLYDPRITVVHHRGLSCAAAPQAARRAYRASQIYYWEKHHGRLWGRAMCAWATLRGAA